MTLAAGRLRHRIVLQSPSYTQNQTTGENVLSWITQAEVWAAIEPLSAREFIAAQATQSEVSARIVIRYRPDVNATWRILHRGRVFNINGVLADQVSGLEYATLPVSEGTNDGE